MSSNKHFDILIVGGGLVGASLACALRDQKLKIGLVEAFPFCSASQPSYDDRSIALAYGTRRIFEGMQLWESLAEQVTAIKKIHISDRGHFGKTRMDCRNSGFDALGYVVENRVMGAMFSSILPTLDNVELMCPAQLKALTLDKNIATAVIEFDKQQQEITAQLVIGADGGRSTVRQLCNIGTTEQDYDQNAIIANVSCEKGHDNIAFERFTDSGPLALLPLSENRHSLVWTVNKKQVDDIMQFDDARFLHHLQDRFGNRRGHFTRVGKRNSYPLTLVRAKAHTQPRLTLIGNAAHTLHPIAGQGFNLGIRDVTALAQVINDAALKKHDLGSNETLRQYENWRKSDQRNVIALTDTLAKVFANNFPPLIAARNAGLLALDVLPPIKRALMRQTMGLRGRLPRLARGLPLPHNQ